MRAVHDLLVPVPGELRRRAHGARFGALLVVVLQPRGQLARSKPELVKKSERECLSKPGVGGCGEAALPCLQHHAEQRDARLAATALALSRSSN